MSFWELGAIWFFLALIADFVAIRLKIAVALSEILVGTAAACLLVYVMPSFADLHANESWIAFLAGSGAVLLTFLAGAELDPKILRFQWKEVSLIGLSGFFIPFLGCAAVAYYFLHWSGPASWIAGVALSTTSVAVVYAVMLELGLNQTKIGKAILAACFLNDLGTVIALGLIFAPFTIKTVIFLLATVLALLILPKLTKYCFTKWGKRHSQLELKFLLVFLFILGYLAFWSGSEPVLPAYLLGMILATIIGKDHELVHKIRALTFSFLTPFYFLRAGSFVSLPALVKAPFVFIVLFFAKMITKSIGVYPAAKLSKYPKTEAIYTTLLMSTGLTFGTISALYGLSHHIIDQSQYTYLVAAVIVSAVIPTLIANAFYLPKHLLSKKKEDVPPELPLS
jgi:glutathione-regulated potassium-efflux system ancillary protein KefC